MRTRPRPSFRRGVGLRRVFGKAVERHQAAVLRLHPAAPMRGGGVANIGDRRPAVARWRRHAPAHQHHFTRAADVADHRRGIVREHARHRRQVADIAVDHAKQREDGGLIGRDRIDGVIAVAARKAQPGREAGEPVAAGAGT
jgi:hypothetical protein